MYFKQLDEGHRTMIDYNAYQELVKKVRQQYQTRQDDEYCWCHDCKEINLWTYWQGKDSKDVKIMVVGQDWGNPQLPKNTQTIKNIRAGKNYFYNQSDLSKLKYQTDKSLCTLFDSIGYRNIITNRYDDLFFTNFFLRYRKGRETGKMSRKAMMEDAQHFRELVSAIKPKVIICLGKMTYECVINALQPDTEQKFRIHSLREYCDKIDSGTNYVDFVQSQIRVYGMAHCGAAGVNINRKRGSKTSKDKSGLDLMIQDWKSILDYLKDKKISLNFHYIY